MKNTIIFSFILLLFAACTEEIIFEPSVYDCQMSATVDNSQHPKNQKFTAALNEVAQHVVGAQVAVRTADGQFWTGASGMADIPSNVALEPCHKTMVGSTSKIYAAVLIFQLQDDNLLDINQPISQYLDQSLIDQIANWDKVTVRQMLNHTSGIKDYLSIRQAVDALNQPFLLETQEEKIRYIYGKNANFEPGTDYEYSNTNYVLLGLIVENLRQMDLDAATERYIAQALGLKNTIMGKELDPIPAGVARPYIAVHGGKYQDVMSWSVSDAATGDGGIATNMQDAILFIEGLFNGDLVSDAALKQMSEDLTLEGYNSLYSETNWYGLGLEVADNEYGKLFGHTGSTSSYNAFLMHFPDSGVSISIAFNGLSNENNSFGRNYDFILKIMDIAFE